MKTLYKTPYIYVEELAKQDVLCASSEGEPSPDSAIENFDLARSFWESLTQNKF